MALILGVDPGSRQVGLGLIRAEAHHIAFVAAHLIKLKSPSVPDRLGALLGTFQAYLNEWKPDGVAIEDTFYSKNVRSLVVMARVSGVLIGEARHLEYPLTLYTPAVVKKTVTGTGQADKEQVAYMVKRFLNLSGNAPQDALDALAVAITQAHSQGL
jgi:crossover junction endodeoxyribonuclease RuvC